MKVFCLDSCLRRNDESGMTFSGGSLKVSLLDSGLRRNDGKGTSNFPGALSFVGNFAPTGQMTQIAQTRN